MAAKKRKSRTPWGWVAFGVGLAVCVGAGGVVGVMLGQSEGGSDADARRVAALALDARGLNEDALSLSRAIEEAIAREELEGEAESLRAELARLEARAERIRARAAFETGGNPSQVREVSRTESRGLAQISRTVTVLERDVVDRLVPVLEAPPVETAADPSVGEALAEVTQVLEEQDKALTALAEDLEEGEGTDQSTAEGAAAREGDLVSGSFQGALVSPESALEIGYELEGLEPEVDAPAADEPEADASGADPEEATITTAAAGELTLKNTGSEGETLEMPTFHLVLYWKEPGVAEGSDACRYEIEGDTHCALARFVFDGEPDHERNGAGELVLRPDDEVSLDRLKPDGSPSVAKRQAGSVAAFIESHPPDFVEVLAKGVEAKDFQPACVVPFEWGEYASEGVIVEPYPMTTLGILTGDGEVVFEAEKSERPAYPDSAGESEAPECYTLLAER